MFPARCALALALASAIRRFARSVLSRCPGATAAVNVTSSVEIVSARGVLEPKEGLLQNDRG